MKIKKIVLPVLTVAIIASCLGACACSSQDELHKMIEKGESIEIEVAEPDFDIQGTESKLVWTPLAELSNYEDFRSAFEQIIGVTNDSGIKSGIAYVNLDGKAEQNNTLYNAFMNKSFVDNYWNNDEVQQAAMMAASENYADVESDSETAKYAAVNAYWNLLPDNEPNYFNGGASLSRAEAMTLLMRATTQVTENGVPASNESFTAIVGESDYTDYASYLDSKAFINTADKSLNNQTFNGTMTRGEYIYLLINNIFGADAINNVDYSNTKLKDCKDGGSKIEAQKFGDGDYSTSYKLVYSLQNPDLGAPTPIYKALIKAKQLDIISAETAWDEALTREDAVELFVEAMLAYSNVNGYKVETENSSEISETDYKAKAIESYNKNAGSLSCPQDTYVNSYVEAAKNGGTDEEIEAFLLEKYKLEPETEAPTEAQPAVDPFSLQPSGSYTDEEVLTQNDYHYLLRTYENGAQRYYLHAYAPGIIDEYYLIEEPGVIPDLVFNDISAKVDKALGIEETPTTSSSTSSNSNTSSSGNSNASGNSNTSNNTSTEEETEYTEVDNQWGQDPGDWGSDWDPAGDIKQ